MPCAVEKFVIEYEKNPTVAYKPLSQHMGLWINREPSWKGIHWWIA